MTESRIFDLRLLACLYFFHFLRHGMIFPLIPLYAHELGYSPSTIGLIIGSFNFLAMLLAIPIGGITDRIGVRRMLLFGVCSNIIHSLLLIVSASGLGLFLAAQLCGGLGFLLIIVCTQTYVTGFEETAFREKGFGLISLTSALGQMIGPILGGWLLSLAGYGPVFALSAGAACLGFCVLGLRQGSRRSQEEKPSLSETMTEIRSLLARPYLAVALLVCFSIIFAYSLRSSFLPLLLQEKGISPGGIGLLLSMFAVSMTLVRFAIGRLMGVVSREWLLAVTMFLLIIGIGMLPLFASRTVLAAVLLVFGLGFGMSQPLTMVMVSDVSHSGLAMGIRFSAINLAAFLSPLVMGGVVNGLGLDWAFYSGSGWLVLVSLLIAAYTLHRRKKRG
ncbi:MAG: MFS transporter [Desulfohalobiaceae bacterium]|nr:MFS transporter [Desulfohalobiaceae bacterium]